jgi:hypothetical protein
MKARDTMAPQRYAYWLTRLRKHLAEDRSLESSTVEGHVCVARVFLRYLDDRKILLKVCDADGSGAVLAPTAPGVSISAWQEPAVGSQNLFSGMERRVCGACKRTCRFQIAPCYNGRLAAYFVLSILAAARVFFSSRCDRAVEILALRQQVAVLTETASRAREHSRPNILDDVKQILVPLDGCSGDCEA